MRRSPIAVPVALRAIVCLCDYAAFDLICLCAPMTLIYADLRCSLFWEMQHNVLIPGAAYITDTSDAPTGEVKGVALVATAAGTKTLSTSPYSNFLSKFLHCN